MGEDISSGAMSAGEIQSGKGYDARTTLPALEAPLTLPDYRRASGSRSCPVADGSEQFLRRAR